MYERPVAENCWELAPGLYRILLPLPLEVPFVNAYLIRSGDAWALIDAGYHWGPSLRALGRALKAAGVPSGGLTHLILTHRHRDHAGGAAPVTSRWGGAVYLHPADTALEAPSPEALRPWLEEAGVPEATRAEIQAAWGPPLDPLPDRVEPLRPEAGLGIGELQFRVIHVPGHSPGHVMLYEPERGWLFAGDHILDHTGPNTWLLPGMAGDPLGEYLRSLEAVADLPEALVLPGHGLPWRGSPGAGARAMAARQRQMLDFVAGLLAHRPMTLWELTTQAAPEVVQDPRLAVWALAAARSQLRHLEAQGRVQLVWEGSRPVWRPLSPARAGTERG